MLAAGQAPARPSYPAFKIAVADVNLLVEHALFASGVGDVKASGVNMASKAKVRASKATGRTNAGARAPQQSK